MAVTVREVNNWMVATLKKGVGVIVPGIGYAFFVNQFDKRLDKGVRTLHWAFENSFIEPLNFTAAIDQQLSTYVANSMPLTDKHGPIFRLNFSAIASKTGYDCQDCMEGFQLFWEEFKRFIRSGQDGNVDLGFGKIVVSSYRIKFIFDQTLMTELQNSSAC